MLVKLKRCHPLAVMPMQRDGDVGFDLSAVEPTILVADAVTKVRIGLMIAGYVEQTGYVDLDVSSYDIPQDYHHPSFTLFSRIEGRSGLASRGIFPVGGIIDPSYRGEIVVMLMNAGNDAFHIEPGDRIAQMIFYPCSTAAGGIKFSEVSDVGSTERGASGFGSTGR